MIQQNCEPEKSQNINEFFYYLHPFSLNFKNYVNKLYVTGLSCSFGLLNILYKQNLCTNIKLFFKFNQNWK